MVPALASMAWVEVVKALADVPSRFVSIRALVKPPPFRELEPTRIPLVTLVLAPVPEWQVAHNETVVWVSKPDATAV
jgi:hypothetical protein